MIFIKILLLIPKLLIKILGYIPVLLLKMLGGLIITVTGICGIVTGLVGAIIVLLGVGFLICGFLGVANLNQIELWWVAALATVIIGAVLASFSAWGEMLGDLFVDIGDHIADALSDIELF